MTIIFLYTEIALRLSIGLEIRGLQDRILDAMLLFRTI